MTVVIGAWAVFGAAFVVDVRGLRVVVFLAAICFAVFFTAFFGTVVDLFFKDLLFMRLCILFENDFSVLKLIVD